MFLCNLFVLLFALLRVTVWASIQAGGSGYAAFFSGELGSIASTPYSLPKNAQGITIAYWARLARTLGGEMNMATISLNTMEPSRSLTSFVGMSHPTGLKQSLVLSINSDIATSSCSSGQCNDSSGETDWTHCIFTWNASTGLLALYVNGDPAPVNLLAQNTRPLIRLYSISQQPRILDCTRTTGGYVLEDTPCVFPFTFLGVTYTSCAPWSATPFVGAVGPRKTRNLGFDRGLKWCATVAQYSKTVASVEKSWGFCSCEDPELVAVDNDVAVYPNATLAWYSGPTPLAQFPRANFITLTNCSTKLESSAVAGRVVFVQPLQKCDTYQFAQKLDSLGTSVIIFIISNPSSLAVSSPTGNSAPSKQTLTGAGTEISWSSVGQQGQCSSNDRLNDHNVSTSIMLPTCELQVASTAGPPFAGQYGFVIPPGVDISRWQWRLYAQSQVQMVEHLVDRRTGTALAQVSQINLARQFFFNFSLPFDLSQDMIVQYRIQFSALDGSLTCSGLALSEFGLFANIDSSSSLFLNGRVTVQSYYAQLHAQGRVFNASYIPPSSTLPRLSAYVLGVNSADVNFLSMLGKVDMEFYQSYLPASSDDIPLTGANVLVIGQSMLNPTAADASMSFTGLLEDLRVYSYQIYSLEANNLYTDGGTFSSGSSSRPNVTVIPPNAALFPLDLPYSLYTFDVQGGVDSGESGQDLQMGSTPTAMDASTLRFEDSSIPARGALYFVTSSIGRVLSGDIIQVMDVNSKAFNLYVKNSNIGGGPLTVTIVVPPKNGTLSNLLVNNGSMDAPTVAIVTYTKRPDTNWTSDSFVYQVGAALSARTARGSVQLIQPTKIDPMPALTEVPLSSGLDVVVSIGGGFALSGAALTVRVDLSSIVFGSLTLASDCSASLLTNTTFPGMVFVRYSAPLATNMPSDQTTDVLRWWYIDSLSSLQAQVRFVVSRPPSVSNQFTPGSFSPSLTVSDGQAFIQIITQATIGSTLTRSGFQIVQMPRFGQLFQYLGSLPKGIVNATSIPSKDFGAELVPPPLDVPDSQRVFASMVMRASSTFVTVSSNQNFCSVTNDCDQWLALDDCCGTTNEFVLDDVLGMSDDSGMRFSSAHSGHEFIEVRFPFQLISQNVVIRHRRIGAQALIRVSVARPNTYQPSLVACGGTPHPFLTSNFSCDLSNQLMMPTTDCATDWTNMWDVVYDRPLCQNMTETVNTGPGDSAWIETTIPLCSLDVAVDTIRLDFDTRQAFDWVEIDSIALVGLSPQQGLLTTVLLPPSVSSLSVVYIPTPGISGQERYSYRTISQACQVSEPVTTVRFQVASSALFQAKSVINVSPSNDTFDFDYTLDITSALDYVASAVFQVSSSAQVVSLWPPSAFIQAYMAFPSTSYHPGLSSYTFEQNKPHLPMSTSTIPFKASNLNANVLIGGDVPVTAEVTVANYSDNDPAAQVTFSYAFSLSGACGQANAALGPCSTLARPYLDGQCKNVLGKYQCECKKTVDPLSDIVVAGTFCQYDSLSTCFGRGYPDDNGVCVCFDPTMFGADQCNKRKYNTTVDDLVEELEDTGRKFSFALSVLGVTSTFVDSSVPNTLRLMGQFSSQNLTLTTLDLSVELDPANNCNGNGVPLKGPLSQCDCNCDDGWFPKQTCLTKLICAFGEFKMGVDEDARCEPCPLGYSCDGLNANLCTNGTFTLSEQSPRCYTSCTDAGVPNAYVVRQSDVVVSCVPCSVGSYCDGLVSQLCPPGTFWSKSKVCVECNDLGLLYYNSDPGALLCPQCPSGTSRVEGTPGVSIQECVCLPGMWNNDPLNVTVTGIPCVDCPDDGVCDGYDVLPSNFRRLLQEQNTTNSTTPKVYVNSGPYPSEGFWGDPNYPSEFFSCPSECDGGKNFSCKVGYRGRLCQRCASGYHNINGLCYECPGGADNTALVFFGITGIVLAFIILNRASEEVQALDIALLYTQVANIVQQFSFFYPPPVDALQNYYGVTDFNIDFITADCVRQNDQWTFEDSFFAQWFLVWYIGLLVLFVNLCAYFYSRFREYRQKKYEVFEKQVDLISQRRRAARAAARQAIMRLELRRQRTGEQDHDAHEGAMGQGPVLPEPDVLLNTPSMEFTDPEIFAGLQAESNRDKTRDARSKRWNKFIKFLRTRVCCWCKRCLPSDGVRNDSQFHIRFDDDDKGDPRFKAIARWTRRTLGFPKNHEDYLSYSNDQLAGWINLVRIVYNSVVIVCLRSFFCFTLADGTSVLVAWPDLVCGTPEHSLLVSFGALGIILYAVGLPVFVYVILTRGSRLNLKATTTFYERFGFLYVKYRQTNYRWELMVLFRRLAMCLILVCANTYPYIQAIFGGLVIVGCLAAQLYYRPYLSDRINVLEGIALSSIFFYLLCGLVFQGLSDLSNAKSTPSVTLDFINSFSSILSYILLIVSLLTILICFLVFLQDLRDFFNVLVTERSLFRKAKSEDVALIRVVRADELKAPKADRDLGKKFLEVATGRKVKTTPVQQKDVLKQQQRKFNQKRRRSSLSSLTLGGLSSRRQAKLPHTLFTIIDKDGNNTISRDELLAYIKDELGLEDEEMLRSRVDRIFRMYDIDVSGTVDVKEFMDMVRAEMPAADECELKNTVKPKYLIKWASSNKVTPLSVALFFELDKSMRTAVADDSVVSAYRDTSQAKFYRSIAEAFPFLTDWLASAKQEDVKAFGKILEELNECRDMVGPRGTFSRITVEIDRAPVVWWLVSATEEERRSFRTVFGAICEASSTTNGHEFPIWRRIKSGSAVQAAQREAESAMARSRRMSLDQSPSQSVFTRALSRDDDTNSFKSSDRLKGSRSFEDDKSKSSSKLRPTASFDHDKLKKNLSFEDNGKPAGSRLQPMGSSSRMETGGDEEDDEASPQKRTVSFVSPTNKTMQTRHLTAEELLGNQPSMDVHAVEDAPPEDKQNGDALHLV